MAGTSFEQLMVEVLNQKQYMEELLSENYELRRQLAGLRDGLGIVLEIQGQRFSLAGETAAGFLLAEPEEQETIFTEQPTTTMPISEAAVGTGTPLETPMPNTDDFELIPYSLNEEEEEEVLARTSSILEDMPVDESATAVTSPMAVRQGSKTRKLASIDEEEKATLRKQLVGSFLLE
jgi:hypothetical protein